MEIIIHIHSKKLDSSLKKAVEEYTKRTSPFCRIKTILYKDISKISFKPSSKRYLICAGTDSPSSEGLAGLIQQLNLSGYSTIEFFILQEDYLSQDYTTISADNPIESFNLSSFSMSTDLTAVVLTEQIYRAYTIMNNITYHK